MANDKHTIAQRIIQAIDAGVSFVFDDGEQEHVATINKRQGAILEGQYLLTNRPLWASSAFTGHVCEEKGLLKHMAKIAPLSEWKMQGGAE